MSDFVFSYYFLLYFANFELIKKFDVEKLASVILYFFYNKLGISVSPILNAS